MPDQTVVNPHMPSQRVPPGPRGNWLLGSLSDIQRNPLDFFMNTAHQYGDIAKFRFLNFKAYFVNHPDYIKHVLQDNHRRYSKQHLDYQMLKNIVGEGLLTSDGQQWLTQRRLIQPAFHRSRIQAFGELMVSATQEMLERWQARAEPDKPLDIHKEMTRLTLSIVGQALFSLDLSDEADTVGTTFTYLNEDLSARFRSIFVLPLSVPTPGNRRFWAARRALDGVVEKIIRTRRAALEANPMAETNDLFGMLLSARDEDTGEGMNDSQLCDEVITLLLAGHETTANALSWTWYLLSQHPQVESRLHQELDSVLNGRLPGMDDLPALLYTRRVQQESLRLYPPAWIISRKAEQDDEIGGYAIPAGSIIEMSPFAMHRNPQFWENPEQFDPERFTAERSANRPAYAYFPFGGGPRLCIGRDFALAEAQLILATVASRYLLTRPAGRPVEPEPLITLRPLNGIEMTVTGR